MESAARRYAEMVAACDHGLLRAHGPLSQAWLHRVKAEALARLNKPTETRRELQQALTFALKIPLKRLRDANITTIQKELAN